MAARAARGKNGGCNRHGLAELAAAELAAVELVDEPVNEPFHCLDPPEIDGFPMELGTLCSRG